MSENDNHEIELEEEEDPIVEVATPSAQRLIFTKTSDPTISGLYDDYKDGTLSLQPDFQRYFVWDNKKSSRLIESVLLNVPLPAIYLAEEDNGTESVIDGQQLT